MHNLSTHLNSGAPFHPESPRPFMSMNSYMSVPATLHRPKTPPTLPSFIKSPSILTPSHSKSGPSTPTEVPLSKPDQPSSTVDNIPVFMKKMESDVQSYLNNKESKSPLEFEDLSWDEFQQFREWAKVSIEGWNKLTVEYLTKDKKCIIQCAGPGHEIMNGLFLKFWDTLKDNPAHRQVVDKLSVMGTAEINLQDGARKQPDFSFLDPNENLVDEERSFPTVVFEVAYTESTRKLAIDCARFVACSLGRGQLAVGIDIKENKKKELETVTITKWECESIEQLDSWPPRKGQKYYGNDLDTLFRTDSFMAMEKAGLVCPPGTQFSCISRLGSAENGQVFVFTTKQVESFSIFPENDDAPSVLQILQRHMYRQPETGLEDEVVYNIPCDIIMQVIKENTGIQQSRTRAEKRKNEPLGVDKLIEMVHKRRKVVSQSKKKSDSKPKAGPSRQKK